MNMSLVCVCVCAREPNTALLLASWPSADYKVRVCADEPAANERRAQIDQSNALTPARPQQDDDESGQK